MALAAPGRGRQPYRDYLGVGLPPYFNMTLNRTLRALAGGAPAADVTALARAASITLRCSTPAEPNARFALRTFVDLAARTFGEFALDVGEPSLAQELRGRIVEVNLNARIDRPPRPGVTTHVVRLFADDGFWSSGWWFGPARPMVSIENPLGAMAAGILAYGELVKAAFGPLLPMARPIAADGLGWSLLDYAHRAYDESDALALRELDLGEVGIVGLGAVGQAAIYALAELPSLSGRLTLIDPQVVTRGNLQRYLTASMRDIGTHKVALARRWMDAHRGLSLPIQVSSWRRFLNKVTPPPTLLVGLDTAAERRALQASLPELILNGWTRTGAAGCIRVVFDGPHQCLACSYLPHRPEVTSDFGQLLQDLGLFPEDVMRLLLPGAALTAKDLTRIEGVRGLMPGSLDQWKGESVRQLYGDICGGALLISPEGAEYVVPLAQASALAGLLLAAELYKERAGLDAYRLVDRVEIDLLQGPGTLLLGPPWLKTEHPAQCICKDTDYLEVFREKWRS